VTLFESQEIVINIKGTTVLTIILL